MGDTVRFAVIGDCHYSERGNYSTRDCLGARDRVSSIVKKLNDMELDFVFSLGDLGNGNDAFETPKVYQAFSECRHTVRYTIGNHDLVLRGEDEHAGEINMPSPIYDFSVKGYRFIVLNGFEISRFSRNEEEKAYYWSFRKNNPELSVQEWPGLLRDTTWSWLEDTLKDAEAKGENVIVFCHVPTDKAACLREEGETEPCAVLVEDEKMLALLGKYKNVRAYIAGHYHSGGLSVRDGVVHKTVRSVCDFGEDTYCVVLADDEKIKIRGYGMESHFSHFY